MAAITVPGAKGGHKGVDNGELHHYWTQDPEGLAKWRDKPHPWTALYHHLRKYIKNEHVAKATASAWYKDVFGHMPNQEHKEKKGGEPVGEVRATVSDKPWSNFSAADYTPEQWRRACLLDTGQGDPTDKGRYKLPVREPGGALNRNGCHAAASVLGGGRGGVQASPQAKQAAARKLAGLYRNELNEDPPDSLTQVAGRSNRFDDAYTTRGERMTSPTFMKGVDGYSGQGGKPMGHGSVDECKAKLKQAIEAGDSQQIAELIEQLANMDPQQRGQQPDEADERKGKMPFPPFAKKKDEAADAGKDKGSDIDAQIANLREQLKQAKAKGDDKTAAAIQAQIDKLTGGVDKAKGKTEGGKGKPAFLQGKGGAGRDGQPEDADERAGYGEGPGGSQKGPSVKAIKAHIKQAQEAGDTELVKKLRAKLAALQGDSDGDGDSGSDTDKDGRGQQPDQIEQRRAAARAAMRSLPVVRSAQGSYAEVIDDEDELDERTIAPGGGVFVRASYRAERSEDGNPVMSLRFSQFNNWYEISSAREGKFLERVAPGAFAKTIGERGGQIKVLFNHGHDGQIGEKILGRVLALEERSDGAHAEIELFDTSYNRDLLPGLRAGAYGSSFMFNVMDDSWEDQPQRSDANPAGLPERTVRQLRLLEFGPVTWPANPGATAGLRSDTDVYCDGLRSAAPDVYNDLEERFSEFRAAFTLGISADQAARSVDLAPEDDDEGTGEDEAALRDDAPVTQEHHAEQPNTNSAETRRSRLILAGVLDAD